MIEFDVAGAFHPETGLAEQDLVDFEPQLEAARARVLQDAQAFDDGDAPAAGSPDHPLDAGFHRLPDRLLADYERRRDDSELGQILAAGRRMSELVDRFVVLGIGGSYMGARALFEALCSPLHNELTRAERGSVPRLYFEGENVDNDATAALAEVLSGGGEGIAGRWGLTVVSKSGGTLETAIALRQFLPLLRDAVGDERLAEYWIPVTGPSGKLHNLSNHLGFRERFVIPDGVGGRFSVFCAVGLLPAAVLGLDVVKLLRGAAAMNAHFASAPAAENLVLRHAAIGRLLETKRGATIRVLQTWGKRLEAVGLWYDQLFAESLGKAGQGATPITCVNTRDLHSRQQQHQEGRADKFYTNVAVDRPRGAIRTIGRAEHDDDGLNKYSKITLPQVLDAARQGADRALRAVGRPSCQITLPTLDAEHVGGLLQMLMLSTVVEGRLMGVNPYGQPGVEDYKINMKEILDSLAAGGA